MRALLPTAVLCVLLSAAPVPGSDDPWAALAERDLRAARAAILADHPGPVDVENPGFRRLLDDGFAAAAGRARRARSYEGYTAALSSLFAVFHDGHMGVSYALSRGTARWPGFTIALRGGRYVVHESGEADVPAGAEVASCDGRALRDWVTQEVFPYAVGAPPGLESTWTRLAPLALTDVGNPLRARAARCTIDAAGVPHDVALQWRPIDLPALQSKTRAAAFGEAPPFAQREMTDGGVWVSMPTFSPDAAGEQALRSAIAEAPGWRNRAVIVWDVRGNSGGSSVWGHDLLRAFYGTLPPPAGPPPRVEWRASDANERYVGDLVGVMAKRFGDDSDAARWARHAAAGIRGALARGESLYREPDDPDVPTEAAASPDPRALQPRVFVLTDGRCGSACLDFVDAALRYPNVAQAGWPTESDSAYMEVRPVPLPSGVATLNLAMKVYRGRDRTGKAFEPRYRFDGEIGDTAALERWVRGLATGPGR